MTTKRVDAVVLLLLGAFITTTGFATNPFSQQMAVLFMPIAYICPYRAHTEDENDTAE
jgi:hypothetical protein